jgi:hypothetical protein
MELIVEGRDRARDAVTSLERPRDREVPRAFADPGSVGGQRTRPYSFLAECECPDDCLLDHANE